MVLLPCPRLQRAMEENAENTDGSDQGHLSTSTYDPSLEISDDGDDAFEAIVVDQPPVGPTVTVTSSETMTPLMSGVLASSSKTKKGKLSLSRISHKIRGRLSRESRLARKFPVITGASPEREPHAKIEANKAVSVSTDILASIAASDGGYDSDARNILTPQLVAQLGVSSLDSIDAVRSADVLTALEDSQAPPQTPPSLGCGGITARSSGIGISSMAAASTDDLTRYSGDKGKAKDELGSCPYGLDSWRYRDISPARKARYEKEDEFINSLFRDGPTMKPPPGCSEEEGKHCPFPRNTS